MNSILATDSAKSSPAVTPATSKIVASSPVVVAPVTPQTTVNGLSGAIQIVGTGVSTQPASQNILVVPNAGGVNLQTASYAATTADSGMLIVFNSSSPLVYTLDNPAQSNRWWVAVQCVGSGGLTINPNGLLLDESVSNASAAQGKGMLIFCDGSNYYTMRGGA